VQGVSQKLVDEARERFALGCRERLQEIVRHPGAGGEHCNGDVAPTRGE
jgi:hypothetical protein